MEVIKELLSNSGDLKVEIFRRSNGTFGFEAYKFSPMERFWLPYGSFSNGIFDSLEAAISEARERIICLV